MARRRRRRSMAQNDLTVKVTLTQLAAEHYRSRIEQSPVGASAGLGHDFALGKADVEAIRSFVGKMGAAEFAKSAEIQEFGSWLFRLVFRDEVLEKYRECRAFATAREAKLRLCIVLLVPSLFEIPWEYLHDGDGFLLRQGHSVLRVIDELEPKDAPFAPIQRVLVAIANPDDPSGEFTRFDDESHRDELLARLKAIGGLTPVLVTKATKDELRENLRSGKFDAVHFSGHGTWSESSGGQLVMEDENRRPDRLDADILAQWIRESGSVRFVYLNSCSTSKTSTGRPFAGVAQRLMRDGGQIAGVIAMQTLVPQGAAMRMAKGFYEALRRGASPELAIVQCRSEAEDLHSWGIPVIYTYLAGAELFDRNRLACLLTAKRGDRYRLLLPTWRLGVPADRAQTTDVTVAPGTYAYRGETFARSDVMAAWYVVDLLSRVASTAQIELAAPGEPPANATHVFAFGSKSNDEATSLLKNFSPSFRFYDQHPEHPGKWVLEDLDSKKVYGIEDPSRLAHAEYRGRPDFGVIQKITRGAPYVLFVLSGLGDRATQGCGSYLRNNWEALLGEFGGQDFGLILEFPAGVGFDFARRIDRATGSPLRQAS